MWLPRRFVSEDLSNNHVCLICIRHTFTTGKFYFAESRILCREPRKRHSVKTALCRGPGPTLGKGLFAEGQTLAVGKDLLCREWCSRQRWALGKVPGRLTAAAVVSFAECQMLGTRQRMVLCRVPACRALGKSFFAECPIWLSAKHFYFFVFRSEFFCEAFGHCFKPYFKVWEKFDFFCYIWLI